MTDSPETEPTADRPEPVEGVGESQSVQPQGAPIPEPIPAPNSASAPSFGEDTPTTPVTPTVAATTPPAASPASSSAGTAAPKTTQRGGLPVAATIAIAALVGGGVGAGVVGTAWLFRDGTSTSHASSQNVTINDTTSVSAVSAVAAKALPSVVTINASDGQSGGTGSGVVISADGYIVTNTHVVTLDGATSSASISVTLSDGSQYAAKLIGTDPNSDLAVVKIEATGLTAIEFADSDALNVGQTTVAIGAPMELSNTVTQGIISALYRGIEIQSSAPSTSASGNSDGNSSGNSPFEFWNYNGQQQQQQQGSGSTAGSSATISLSVIQTDAAINPGNSGGALLDTNAKLIGINVAILSGSSTSETAGSIGIGFAIPSNQVKRVSQEIISNGNATHGLLGASVTSTAADASTKGALVKEVTAGGPAATAGIQAGDVITQFNGVRVKDQVDLTAMVRAQAAGSDATVVAMRNGQAQTFKVKLGTYGG